MVAHMAILLLKCPYGRSNVHMVAQMSQYVAQMDSRSSVLGFMVAQMGIRVAQKVTRPTGTRSIGHSLRWILAQVDSLKWTGSGGTRPSGTRSNRVAPSIINMIFDVVANNTAWKRYTDSPVPGLYLSGWEQLVFGISKVKFIDIQELQHSVNTVIGTKSQHYRDSITAKPELNHSKTWQCKGNSEQQNRNGRKFRRNLKFESQQSLNIGKLKISLFAGIKNFFTYYMIY